MAERENIFNILLREVPKQWDESNLKRQLEVLKAGLKTQVTLDKPAKGRGAASVPLPGLLLSLGSLPDLANLAKPGTVTGLPTEYSDRYERLLDAQLKKYGIDRSTKKLSPEENVWLAGGEMLGQLPVPASVFRKGAQAVTSKPARAMLLASEYFSPVVEPRFANYAVGTTLGGSIRNFVDDSLAEEPQNFATGGLARLAKRMAEEKPARLEPPSVIKAPGGNWPVFPEGSYYSSIEDVIGELIPSGSSSPAANWAQTKLKRYIQNDMGTERDPIRKLAEKNELALKAKRDAFAKKQEAKAKKIAEAAKRGEDVTTATRNLAAENAEMGTKLQAEEAGLLHVIPRSLVRFEEDELKDAYTIAQKLQPGVNIGLISDPSKSAAAANWEKLSDLSISVSPARKFDYDDVKSLNPWLDKVDPASPVYSVDWRNYFSNPPGFNHLLDELSNAVTDTTLPKELRLTQDQLDRMSMEAASQHVGKINTWRELNRIEANKTLAQNPATFTYKEYPEGFRWVELRKGEDTGKQVGMTPEDPRFSLPTDVEDEFYDAAHRQARRAGLDPDSTPDEYMAFVEEQMQLKALDWANKNKLYEDASVGALRQALKYEGDTMGHCVGGYCEDVLEGRSRIFSLRDAKGEPHVTIEVEPPSLYPISGERVINLLGPEKGNKLWDEYSKALQEDYSIDLVPFLQQRYPEVVQQLTEGPGQIIQVKGKGNAAPSEKYLPFVQDFVKAGRWSSVGDLRNTGLRRVTDAFNENELAKIRGAGIEVPDFATQAEIDAINQQVWGVEPKNFAQGGLVYIPDEVDTMANQLLKEIYG